MTKTTETNNENTTEASCRVTYCNALTGEAHTIKKTLIKPCAVKLQCTLNEKAKKKLGTI
jgi:hypothetical protein